MSEAPPPPEAPSPRKTGREMEPSGCYTASDLPREHEALVPPPGQYPFTRGIHPDGYRRKLWTMRQYAGFSDAEESNRRYRYLLSQGTTGLSVAFDLPTQIGYDSDHPNARGEVGRVGVPISTLEDMRRLFAEIPLDQVTTSMTINATAPILLAFYLVVAEERGIPWTAIGGTVQNDILKEYAARGTYIFPPEPSMRLATDLIEFCARQVPKWNPISISGYHMREAGCTAVQEVAFTLAHGLAYVEAVLQRGLDIDEFAGRLSFFFNAHNPFLVEVAKFRAARRLWAELVRERYRPRQERSLWLRFHTQTAGSALTAQQPENNIVRVAIQALAAVCGGTQSLHTNAFDEALGLPTERSARIALRTQQILACESGVAEVVDPLGGAWAIEALTDEIVRGARELIERIDDLGGALRALEQGFQMREIADAAYAFQRAVESGEQKVVGVNCYQDAADEPIEVLAISPEREEVQACRVAEYRTRRDQGRTRKALEALEACARGPENLMPPILDAIRCGATLGEIAGTLRGVFGEHREILT